MEDQDEGSLAQKRYKGGRNICKSPVNGNQNSTGLHPSVQKLHDTIENDTRLWHLFNTMFNQIPNTSKTTGTGKPHPANLEDLCEAINGIISSGIEFNEIADSNGLTGQPLEALLSYPFGTTAGFAAFQDPQVNALFKPILNTWGDYLKSPSSRGVLNTQDGWLGPTARKLLEDTANKAAGTSLTFSELFISEPDEEYYGFQSWDNFFTRRFVPGVRPVADPDNDTVITNACEAQTQAVAHNVKARDEFWIKSQPYSIKDMLAGDPLAERFVGGTVFQALLSALSYHRWHSPVTGTIKKTYVVPGKYYSEPLYEGAFREQGPAMEGFGATPSYQSAVATRALIFIEADNPDIGLVCVMQVGLCEVSSVDVTVHQGQYVRKGDEIGMFHYGGSTWLMLFEKGVNVLGLPQPGSSTNVPVNSCLAVVEARS